MFRLNRFYPLIFLFSFNALVKNSIFPFYPFLLPKFQLNFFVSYIWCFNVTNGGKKLRQGEVNIWYNNFFSDVLRIFSPKSWTFNPRLLNPVNDFSCWQWRRYEETPMTSFVNTLKQYLCSKHENIFLDNKKVTHKRLPRAEFEFMWDDALNVELKVTISCYCKTYVMNN